ncbi:MULTISPECIES: tetratricopeptide repeat protein [Sphingobium]|mgnify:CR=1 FL=1|uniref:tetratricopeptide repeat protein n=1 Tax=Sphingobium TaxID=165695 RepID=UPI000C58C121|nr:MULTISPECIES: SPOR domain-containing protein [Sphingobium]MBA37405.1 sporulation protein [Sphingobium sp.]MBS48043.1 sporulation protein [Sphingobium sp.]MCC4255482.1 tetratricopeptide repeat protein [Sphingobium lactosutens]
MTKSLPWILAALFLAPPAFAQTDQADLVPPLGAADLNRNLARLASNPRDVDAMIGAGEAALALDDPHGAAGFFARADAIASGNGRIKAGLARVMLKLQNPAEAVRLFDQAQRLGFPDTSILMERGLARDLTGDQAGAQRDYQAALARSPDNAELRRRYAASLGISGQVDAAESMLEPLLYKSDRAAWRYRAFIYAMNNRQADAKKVAEQAMPARLAAAITPYMQKMPYLTAQQKAAAVHFGQFPSQVGTTVAAVTPTTPPPAATSAAPASAPATQIAQVPTQSAPSRSRPLSRAEQRRQRREAARLARAEGRQTPMSAPRPSASSQPAPTPTASPPNTGAATQVAQAQTVQSLPARAAQPVVQPLPRTPSAASPSGSPSMARAAAPSVQGPPAPGFASIEDKTPAAAAPAATPGVQDTAVDGAASPPTVTQPSVAAPAPAASQPAPPAPDPQATRTLADIIRAIDVPEAERQATVAAVDLNEIAAMQAARRAERQAAAAAAAAKAKRDAAAKAKAEADAKAKKEAEEKKRLAANPSRNWLQVGVGQSKSALAFTMKRLRGKYDSIAPQDAWTASWGQTNRLLVGPFPSFTRARELETKLKAAGADVFAWKSDAGEVVEKLAGE